MKIVVGGKDKLQTIVQAFPNIWDGTVLDVGCRDKKLKYLCFCFRYYSLDIDSHYKPDITADIGQWSDYYYEEPRFDTIAALDVLEHTDNFCAALRSICRASRKYVLISLPNLYYYKHRIKFLFGKNHSAKYGLPLTGDCSADRHRWLFTLSDARDFVRVYASACNFRILEEVCLAGPRFRYLKFLPKWWPTLFTRTYVVLLKRR